MLPTATPRSLLVLVAAWALGVAGCSAADAPPVGAYSDAPLSVLTSEAGALRIEVRTSPEQPPARGTSDVELRIADASGQPRDDLTVTAKPWMPAMGHGAAETPTVEAASGGRYVVHGVNLFMAGRWELQVSIEGALHDAATATFDVP